MKTITHLHGTPISRDPQAPELEIIKPFRFPNLHTILRNAEQCDKLHLLEERNEWLRKAQRYISGMRWQKEPLSK